MKLRGGPSQVAGGVWIVDSPGEVESLSRVLSSTPHPVGLDLEYTYVKKRHALDHTRATCMTLAYVDPSLGLHPAGCPLARRVFIPAFEDDSLIQLLKPWLEDETKAKKVGHNIISADAHVLHNHGIILRGIETDTLRTSRMAYNSKDIKHGLKPRMQAELGYDVIELDAVLQRPKRLKGKVYKRVSTRVPGKSFAIRIPTLFGGEVSCVSWSKRESIPQVEYWRDYPREPFIDYASLDAKGTLELSYLHKARLRRLPARGGDTWALWNDFWRPYCLLIAETERNGVLLDLCACTDGAMAAGLDIAEYDDALHPYRPRVDDWNWNSPAQLKQLFYQEWRLPRSPIKGTMRAIKPTRPGEFCATEASIHWLQLQCKDRPDLHLALDLIRRRKKAVRLMGYLTSLPGFVHGDGRLHPAVAPSTDTGRLAASIPPLQQIPGVKGDKYGIRRAFVAGPGNVLVVADYSQLEVYILAHYLRRLFKDDSIADALATGDVYGAVAKECWPDELAGIDAAAIKHHPSKAVQARRDTSKVVVLATNYCMSAQGLAISLLDETGQSVGLEAASAYLSGYDNRFPGVGEFQRHMARMAAKHGGVSDIMGFWRPLPAARSDYEGDRAAAFRQAANTPIQGSAAKIVALAMLLLKRRYPWVTQLLQVHDEIIAEVPESRGLEAAAVVEECMVAAGQELGLLVPLKAEVKVARCWADGK